MFTDLAGFTAYVESVDPAEVVPALNEYLDALVQVAFRHEGTIDKIVGDAVHVIFGAPVGQPDHAERAVACALEMDRVAGAFDERIGTTRIGVNSGPAVVGNFGGDALFDYTAHGDAVNVAARLEAANKHLGTRVCVSAGAAERVPGFRGRPIGTLRVRGKNREVAVYEPLDDERAAVLDVQAYAAAYALMAKLDERALEAFQALAARCPGDPLAALHRDRLRAGETGVVIALPG